MVSGGFGDRLSLGACALRGSGTLGGQGPFLGCVQHTRQLCLERGGLDEGASLGSSLGGSRRTWGLRSLGGSILTGGSCLRRGRRVRPWGSAGRGWPSCPASPRACNQANGRWGERELLVLLRRPGVPGGRGAPGFDLRTWVPAQTHRHTYAGLSVLGRAVEEAGLHWDRGRARACASHRLWAAGLGPSGLKLGSVGGHSPLFHCPLLMPERPPSPLRLTHAGRSQSRRRGPHTHRRGDSHTTHLGLHAGQPPRGLEGRWIHPPWGQL